jgi:hypothetical protein
LAAPLVGKLSDKGSRIAVGYGCMLLSVLWFSISQDQCWESSLG